MAAAWFNNALVDVVQKLIVLSLPGTPAAEVLPLTTQVWIDTLWTTRQWTEAHDLERLHTAGVRLAASSERWPAPKDLLRELPPRPEQLALPPARTLPTPEQAVALQAARAGLILKRTPS